MSVTSVRFYHGLGDVACFAHTIPLYTRRGHEVAVECTPDKAPLIEAAGGRVIGRAEAENRFLYPECVPQVHDWHNPGLFPRPTFDNAWVSNKVGRSLSESPMPDVGPPEALWDELCAVRLTAEPLWTDRVRSEVDAMIADLPRPLVLIHPQGNSSPELKNLDRHEQFLLIHSLLDRMAGTIVLLDWDDRVVKCANHRVRHMGDDFRPLSVPELTYLTQRSDLFIGVDSGPLHAVRFTDCPAIGLWTKHYPGHFILPRERTLNLTTRVHADGDRWRRHEFLTICGPDERLKGQWIAERAAEMLGPTRFLPPEAIARDVQLRHFLARTRSHSARLSCYVDRDRTFGLAMEHLTRQADPTMVETGTIRGEEDWGGAGFSTYLFGALLRGLGRGTLHSVELDGARAEFARRWTTPFADHVRVHARHSHDFLREFPGPIDVFYSDSLDTDEPGHGENCLEEVRLAIPQLRDHSSLVLIDDTVHARKGWHGKGHLAVPWLIDHGWEIVSAGYQALLRRSPRS